MVAIKVSSLMNLPLVNVDDLIYEALLEDKTLASNEINKLITKAFVEVASDEDLTRKSHEGETRRHFLSLRFKAFCRRPRRTGQENLGALERQAEKEEAQEELEEKQQEVLFERQQQKELEQDEGLEKI